MTRRYFGRPFEEDDLATQGEQFRVFLHLGKDVPITATQNKAIGAESPRVFDFLFHEFFENDLVDEGEVGNDLRTIRFIEKWDFPFLATHLVGRSPDDGAIPKRRGPLQQVVMPIMKTIKGSIGDDGFSHKTYSSTKGR